MFQSYTLPLSQIELNTKGVQSIGKPCPSERYVREFYSRLVSAQISPKQDTGTNKAQVIPNDTAKSPKQSAIKKKEYRRMVSSRLVSTLTICLTDPRPCWSAVMFSPLNRNETVK